MNKLRPHHLLCTQGYSGKGYSEDFVENMDIVVEDINYIKENITEEIMDDICGSCEWYSISHCKKRMGC